MCKMHDKLSIYNRIARTVEKKSVKISNAETPLTIPKV